MEENTEDQVEPRWNKRDLRFPYKMAPAHEKMFGQPGKYLNFCINLSPVAQLKLKCIRN